MDFLDPIKRRRHRHQLMIGYALIAILILLIVRFFVIWASGETINPRTGKISDYGLLFVDSKPGGAQIYINGQSKGTTSARLSLLAGTYEVKLSRTGYYDWQNKLNLSGQSVDRLVYPFLFPKDPKPANLKAYTSLPTYSSSSPDRHWLLISLPPSATNFSFDLYDTSKPAQAPVALPVPASLLTNTSLPNQSLSVVEWANDNNHMLLKHSSDGGDEFIVFSRTDTNGNLNLNRQFNVAGTAAGFNHGRAEQIYLYNQSDQSLSLANTQRSNLTAILSKVSDWKVIDTDLIFYTTADGSPAGQLSYKIFDNGKTYKLTDSAIADKQLFEAHAYQSHWYYVLGSNLLGRTTIYKDPLDTLKSSAQAKASPLLSFLTPGISSLSFSEKGRLIEAQSGQQFNLYDTETGTRYKYNLKLSTSPMLDWMDDQRLIGDIDNQIFVMDFDAQNQHQLIPAATGAVEFDSSFNHMYSFSLPAADGVINLQVTDLRAGADLPKP